MMGALKLALNNVFVSLKTCSFDFQSSNGCFFTQIPFVGGHYRKFNFKPLLVVTQKKANLLKLGFSNIIAILHVVMA